MVYSVRLCSTPLQSSATGLVPLFSFCSLPGLIIKWPESKIIILSFSLPKSIFQGWLEMMALIIFLTYLVLYSNSSCHEISLWCIWWIGLWLRLCSIGLCAHGICARKALFDTNTLPDRKIEWNDWARGKVRVVGWLDVYMVEYK